MNSPTTPALLESLIAQRKRCHGTHANGDHPHSPRCRRCRAGIEYRRRHGVTN